MGGDSALELTWGLRVCALRQSFYEAPGICLGEKSLIKETNRLLLCFLFWGKEEECISWVQESQKLSFVKIFLFNFVIYVLQETVRL